MSTTTDDRSAKLLSSLLVEYTQKIGDMCARGETLANHWRECSPEEQTFVRELVWANMNKFSQLSGKFNTLARDASQWVEHGAIEDPVRLELKMRLAELEAQIQYVQSVINAVQHAVAA